MHSRQNHQMLRSTMSPKLVRPGDVLTEVNGQNVRDMPFSRVINLLGPPTPITNRDLKYRRRAATTANNSPDTTVGTASPSTERSSPSYNCLSPVEPRPGPRSPPAVDSKIRAKVPPPADADRLTSRRHRFSFDGLGHGGAMKTLFASPRVPSTPGRQTFSSRLAAWGGGTPGGKRTPRSRLRTFGRALSLGSSPKFPSSSRSQALRSPSPCSTPVERTSLQPVTVNPAPRTTLMFRTRRRKGAGAEAGERKENLRAITGTGAGTRTHDRRMSEAGIFDVDEEAEDEEEQHQEEEGSYDHEEPQPYKIRVMEERDFNVSSFFAVDEEEECEQEQEGAAFRPPSPHASESDGGDGEEESVSRSSSGVAVLKAEEGFQDEGVAAASAAVTAVSKPEDVASLIEAEFEEDEVVSLSSYLACADRGWPWKGSSVIWAEYVSLSGRHRWVRSEGCRHALLVVSGAMYLLEIPADAAHRHKAERPSTQAPGGWFLELTAADLKSVTIPLSPAEMTPRDMAVDSGADFSPHGVFGPAKGEIIFHGKSGGSTWLECTTAGRRDALADVLSAWHSEETRSSTVIEVSRVSIEEALETVPRGNAGRHIMSLISNRTAHRTW